MTINEVIADVDVRKPNPYDDATKAEWIGRLDNLIHLQVFKDPELIQYNYPEDGDQELLVGHPFEDIYPLFVFAQIDFHNREYGNYNNSVAMFEASFDNFKKQYIRDHMPKSAGGYRNVMG